MSNQTAEQPQYVYFVTNEDGSANVEANSIQPQIVFTTEGFSSVVEAIDYENPENADSNADIWSKCNNALRDLLVFLVKKHLLNYILLEIVNASNTHTHTHNHKATGNISTKPPSHIS